jgi:monoamine oxidase
MGFSLLNKIYLQFSQIFWERNLRRINVIDNQFQFYFCLPEFDMLALYVSGSFAKQLEQKTDQQIIDEIFNSLQKIYPQITYPIKWLITRWNQDPFSKGSYSTFHCGSHSTILKQLAQETHDGHVHWAGEHTNYNGCIGYVDSGFQTGFREAKAIIKKLYPEISTYFS